MENEFNGGCPPVLAGGSSRKIPGEKKRDSLLFRPFTVGTMTLKNRVVMMPMGTNFALETGGISDRHIHYYEQRARGGTGLIVVENVCVDYPLGANGATQLRLDHDRFLPGMVRLCEAIHRHGGCAAVQLNHAGASARSSRTGVTPVSASAVMSKPGGEIPRPLTEKEMETIALRFGESAFRAKRAGFDAVEFHGGHGYLISQFLSPATNRRQDRYGGSPENRARFPRMVLEEIRRRVGAGYPILVRVSLDEFTEGGSTIADSLELMSHFCGEADLFSVSAGSNSSLQFQIDHAALPDGWRAYMAKAVKERFGKPAITMGNIRDPQVAEEILARGDADLIGIGRGLIAEPEWVKKVQSGREDCLRSCISCNIGCAGNRIGLDRPIRCTVNPAVDQGEDYAGRKVKKPCNVVVVGGGVAGLEAACTAAEVGCTVVLLERGERLGGLTASLSKISGEFRMKGFIDYQVRRAERLKNLFALPGTEATAACIARFHPDLIVNATGSRPLLPPIPGLADALRDPNSGVYTIKGAADQPSLRQMDLRGKRVAVAGGGAAGAEAVAFFAKRGAVLTVVEQSGALGSGLDPVSRCSLLHDLAHYPVTICTETSLESVGDHCLAVRHGAQRREIPFDYAYICLGMLPSAPLLDDLYETFRQSGTEILNIGDSAQARRMIDGVREGRNILLRLEQMGCF